MKPIRTWVESPSDPSADQSETHLAVWATPVLHDLAVANAQDGCPVDLDPFARRRDIEERRAVVGSDHGPVRDHQIVRLDQQVHGELVVGKRRLHLAPPLLLASPYVLADPIR